MSEEQPVFKVTDRRLFNSDGTPREIERGEEATETAATAAPAQATETAPAAEAPPPPQAKQPTRPAAAAPPAPESAGTGGGTAGATLAQDSAAGAPAEEFPEEDYAEADIPGADDPASFINFLMSIASNAAAALGMMEHPATGQRTVDLELAHHWIDVLGMLRQKTRGNLAPQEEQIFEGLLADLRMQYVSLTSERQPKAPRGFTGSDIIGGK